TPAPTAWRRTTTAARPVATPTRRPALHPGGSSTNPPSLRSSPATIAGLPVPRPPWSRHDAPGGLRSDLTLQCKVIGGKMGAHAPGGLRRPVAVPVADARPWHGYRRTACLRRGPGTFPLSPRIPRFSLPESCGATTISLIVRRHRGDARTVPASRLNPVET